MQTPEKNQQLRRQTQLLFISEFSTRDLTIGEDVGKILRCQEPTDVEMLAENNIACQ